MPVSALQRKEWAASYSESRDEVTRMLAELREAQRQREKDLKVAASRAAAVRLDADYRVHSVQADLETFQAACAAPYTQLRNATSALHAQLDAKQAELEAAKQDLLAADMALTDAEVDRLGLIAEKADLAKAKKDLEARVADRDTRFTSLDVLEARAEEAEEAVEGVLKETAASEAKADALAAANGRLEQLLADKERQVRAHAEQRAEQAEQRAALAAAHTALKGTLAAKEASLKIARAAAQGAARECAALIARNAAVEKEKTDLKAELSAKMILFDLIKMATDGDIKYDLPKKLADSQRSAGASERASSGVQEQSSEPLQQSSPRLSQPASMMLSSKEHPSEKQHGDQASMPALHAAGPSARDCEEPPQGHTVAEEGEIDLLGPPSIKEESTPGTPIWHSSENRGLQRRSSSLSDTPDLAKSQPFKQCESPRCQEDHAITSPPAADINLQPFKTDAGTEQPCHGNAFASVFAPVEMRQSRSDAHQNPSAQERHSMPCDASATLPFGRAKQDGSDDRQMRRQSPASDHYTNSSSSSDYKHERGCSHRFPIKNEGPVIYGDRRGRHRRRSPGKPPPHHRVSHHAHRRTDHRGSSQSRSRSSSRSRGRGCMRERSHSRGEGHSACSQPSPDLGPGRPADSFHGSRQARPWAVPPHKRRHSSSCSSSRSRSRSRCRSRSRGPSQDRGGFGQGRPAGQPTWQWPMQHGLGTGSLPLPEAGAQALAQASPGMLPLAEQAVKDYPSG